MTSVAGRGEAAAPPGGIVDAARRAVPVFLSGRMLALLMLPLVGAPLLWLLVAALGFKPLVAWLEGAFGAGGGAASGWISAGAGVLATLLFVAAAVVTALALIAVFAMPVIVRTVAARDFPNLEWRHGGGFTGSLLNTATTLLVFVPLWLVSLPLLLFAPLWIAASLLLSAWLNQRLFRYDALAEHADAAELALLTRALSRRAFGLGLLLSPLSLVPVVNLVAPLYAGIAFAYLCLDALARLRAASPPAH